MKKSGLLSGVLSLAVILTMTSESWAAGWTRVLTGSVRAVATAPGATGGSVLFAGCLSHATLGPGVLRSTDGGLTWENVLPGQMTNSLANDPFSAGTVYAATNGGLYKTTDYGATWSLVNAGVRMAVATSPVSAGVVFADNQKSSDGGANWVDTGCPVAYSSSESEIGHIKPSSDPNVVYAVHAEIGYVSVDGGLSYFSVDAADTIEPIPGTPFTYYNGGCAGSERCTVNPVTRIRSCSSIHIGGHTHAIAVYPGNVQKVFAASRSSNLQVSLDGGTSWNSIGGILEFYPAGRMIIDEASGTVYLPTGVAGLHTFNAACIDLDGDGRARDCAPLDCDDQNAAINPDAAEVCNDCVDNNCNGLTDRFDPLAVGCTSCYDDDCDGFSPVAGCGSADCDDANPLRNPGVLETCFNALDDNCNGLADCADRSCRNDLSCAPATEICGDGLDNDWDGKTDCADRDCRNAPECSASTTEICSDGVDNDGDRKVDCNDPDCSGDPACPAAAPEVCDDGIDNDLDGKTDCADRDCRNNVACK